MVQWTISSDERREPKRAAGSRRDVRRSSFNFYSAPVENIKFMRDRGFDQRTPDRIGDFR